MSKAIAAASAAALLLLSAQTATADVVLDQSSVPESGLAFPITASGASLLSFGLGQSFTVGVDGVLDHVDVGVFNFSTASTNTLTFKVLANDGAELFSEALSPTLVPDLVVGGTDWAELLSVSVRGAGIQVAAGDQLQWALFASGSSHFNQALVHDANYVPIGYDGGNATIYGFVPGAWHQPGIDYAFRTYVDTAVPEPAAWALMILGFGGAGVAMRRHRRRMAFA